jgi:hypothetical protein
MAATCVTPFKARAIRLIKLNACGVPISGTGSAVLNFTGFVSVAVSPQYEDGTEYIQKTANGDFCVNQKDRPLLKRANITLTVCVIDPDMLVMTTGQRLLTAGAPATGTGVAYGEDNATNRFSLELWQPLAGAGACTPSGIEQFLWWLFGNVGNVMVGDFTFEQGTTTFTITGETAAMYTGWPTSIGALLTGLDTNTIGSREHWLHNVTSTQPPVGACGAVPL